MRGESAFRAAGRGADLRIALLDHVVAGGQNVFLYGAMKRMGNLVNPQHVALSGIQGQRMHAVNPFAKQ